MASLAAAESARNAKADELRQLGAHSIEVAQMGPQEKQDYGVVAYFAKQPRKRVPKTIEVTHGRKKHTVPVRVKIAQQFKPEQTLE